MNHQTGCNQGRCGMASTNASRAAIGLAPLPEPDEPLETPESAERKSFDVAVFLLVLVTVALAALAQCLFPNAPLH